MYYKCVQTVQTLYLCDEMYVVSMIHTYSDKYNIWSHGTDSLSGMIRAATSSSMLMCWWVKISYHYVVKHFCGLNSRRTEEWESGEGTKTQSSGEIWKVVWYRVSGRGRVGGAAGGTK